MGKQFYFIIKDSDGNDMQRIKLKPNKEYIIGRNSQNADIVIADNSISRKHAKLIVGVSSLSIQDLGSINGTFIEERKITANTLSILRKDIRVKFADSKDICFIEEEIRDDIKEPDFVVSQSQRSRSRSADKKKQDKKTIRKENQIWNMGDLTDEQRKKMKKLMGVKDVTDEIQEDNVQKDIKKEINKRNQDLEYQFGQALYKRDHKQNGLGF